MTAGDHLSMELWQLYPSGDLWLRLIPVRWLAAFAHSRPSCMPRLAKGEMADRLDDDAGTLVVKVHVKFQEVADV